MNDIRSLLLEFGADVKDVPVAEFKKPVQARLGSEALTITEFSIQTEREHVDVTSMYGAPSYISYVGSEHSKIDMTCIAPDYASLQEISAQYMHGEMEIDHVVHGYRLTGKVMIRSCYLSTSDPSGSIELSISGYLKDFEIEDLRQPKKKKQKALPERAMDLS